VRDAARAGAQGSFVADGARVHAAIAMSSTDTGSDSVAGPRELTWQELVRTCSVEEIGPAAEPAVIGRLGQDRALEALEFGLAMRYPDYHLFAAGAAGLGKHATVHGVLAAHAAAEPPGLDECYVRCFEDERRAALLRVPAGRGAELRRDVARVLEEIALAIPAAFSREDARKRRTAIAQHLSKRRDDAFAALQARAAAKDILLVPTESGFTMAPVCAGKPLTPDQFQALPEAERASITEIMRSLEDELASQLIQAPQWIQEARDETRALDREIAEGVVARALSPVSASWADHGDVAAWLVTLAADVVDNVADFLSPDPDDEDDATRRQREVVRDRRYAVKVLVDRGASHGAAVVYEDNPTLENLIGRIETRAEGSDREMDVTLIVGGALHRANGGYLVLDAAKLVEHPSSWSALKRTLFARAIRIESVTQAMGLGRVASLEAEPIPLEVKCVLIGDRMHYELLAAADPEFGQLFKVLVEFEADAARTPQSTVAFGALARGLARQNSLREFDASAIARVVEHSARLAGDAGRLSLELQALSELLREADHVAFVENAPVVARTHVDRALADRWRRHASLRERMLEQLSDGTHVVATQGAVIGQVNALTVFELGRDRFARPTRVTARVRVGRGGLVDVARETRLGGPIHSKGVLTLSGFLAGRYFSDGPLGLSASLVFEQSYGRIEGDSASLAELCAVVSAIAELPARQALAVTGSIDQLGRVQAVGAIDEKIEGFFAACGLLGSGGEPQGVVIPRACARRLMVRAEVVDAVRDGRFHVWPVDTADEALALLLGRPAGTRGADGSFPADSINGRVEARLRHFAESLREHDPDERL
jgi:predicted ATP-dependent protease